jgi:Zn-finger protein
MNETKSAYINGGMEFWVRFSDGSKAKFGICSDCLKVSTQEQIDKILEKQKINWGQEIQATLNWYVHKAINLKVIKWAKEENGLKA